MRLSHHNRRVIRDTAREIFGEGVEIRLFGSRLDDNARGGDIDLLVVSPTPIADRVAKSLRLVARLQIRLGDQPIDVLVWDPEVSPTPVHLHALETGEAL